MTYSLITEAAHTVALVDYINQCLKDGDATLDRIAHKFPELDYHNVSRVNAFIHNTLKRVHNTGDFLPSLKEITSFVKTIH